MEPKRAGFDDPDVEAYVLREYEIEHARELLAEMQRLRKPSQARSFMYVAKASAVLGAMLFVAAVMLVLVAALSWDVGRWIWGTV